MNLRHSARASLTLTAATILTVTGLTAPALGADRPCKNFSTHELTSVSPPFHATVNVETAAESGDVPICTVVKGRLIFSHPASVTPTVTISSRKEDGNAVAVLRIDWNLPSIPAEEEVMAAGRLRFRLPSEFPIEMRPQR